MPTADLQYSWPPLPMPYAAALREAVEFVAARFEVLGIFAAGSIVRGTPDATSDLDIYVIHDSPFRQRIQRVFCGVPAEIFVNPPHVVRQYFAQEHADGRPLTAHMLSTGWTVISTDPVVEALRSEAMTWLSKPSQPADARVVWERYMAANLYEDAMDVVDRDPPTAIMLLDQAVTAMLCFWFRSRGLFLPRHKELLSVLASMDPDLGKAAQSYFVAPWAERVHLSRVIADHSIGVYGFFEWESEPEKMDG